MRIADYGVLPSRLTVGRAWNRALAIWLLAVASAAIGSTAAHGAMSGSPNPSNNGNYTVSWSPVTGALSYQLVESANGGAPTTYFVGSHSKSFTGKTPGSYAYQVADCVTLGPPAVPMFEIRCGYSFGSVTVTVRPPIPTGLDAPPIDYNGAYSVSWDAASGATSYKLRERFNSGTWSTIHSGSATSKSRTGRAPGTWSYSVRSCIGSSNCSNWSTARSVQVPAPPAAPTGLSGPATDYNGAFTMSWNSSSGANTYKLLEVRPNDSTHTYTTSATSKSISGKGGAPGTYSYRVRGCNVESVCGSWSGYVDVEVKGPPNAPVLNGPVAPVPHDESYTISWSDTDSETYELEEQPAGGAWQSVPPGPALLSKTLSNDPGVYSYRVRACNPEDVCSGWSSPTTVTVQLTYTTTYRYDALGRLIQVKHPNGVETDYQYDSADNRISKESSLEN